MRPVDKGHKDKEYKPYATAKRELFNAIGPYCSYCERGIEHMGAVEHKQPKSRIPELEYSWDNFLLSCVNCNSIKRATEINDSNINDFVWPDVDDTYHMIQYDPVTLIPSPADNLSEIDKARVSRLIRLVGLDRAVPKEDTLNYKKASDTRVEDRMKVALDAKSYKQFFMNLQDDIKPAFVDQLKILVKYSGYWSIWMHELEDIPEIRTALLECLPGTRRACFQETGSDE